MTALLLLAMLSQAPDAPVLDAPGVSVHLKTNEPAPFEGQLLSDAEDVRRGQEHAFMRGELEKAHDSWLVPKPVLVAVVVAAVLAAVAAGIEGVALAAKR